MKFSKALPIVFLFIFCLSLSSAGEFVKVSPDQLNNLGIKLGSLEQVTRIPLFYAPAKVSVPPANEQIVSAPQSGFVAKLLVSVGDPVEQGQILASINSSELLTMQRNFLKSESDRILALANYKRDRELYKEGVISNRRWQESKARYSALVTEVSETSQLLAMTGMSVSDIKKLKEKRLLKSLIEVRAPLSGVVLDRRISAGQRVDRLAPLFHIANLRELWLEINIPQEHVQAVHPGDWVTIDKTSITARVALLGQSVNPNNQTVLARAVVDGQPTGIRIGQRVNTQIIRKLKNAAFKIVASAVARREGQSYIFIQTDVGFKVQPVKTLGRENRSVIIGGELNGQGKVAIEGAVAIKAIWMGLGGDE